VRNSVSFVPLNVTARGAAQLMWWRWNRSPRWWRGGRQRKKGVVGAEIDWCRWCWLTASRHALAPDTVMGVVAAVRLSVVLPGCERYRVVAARQVDCIALGCPRDCDGVVCPGLAQAGVGRVRTPWRSLVPLSCKPHHLCQDRYGVVVPTSTR
jgi:hypothetical protein